MPGVYRFASFELRTAERTLLADGRPVALGARAFDVLLALVARGGALVSKDELLCIAWPGLVVEEANVHVQVSHLRRVLGARAIATVPGLGYRFAMAIEGAGAAEVPHNLPAERSSFVGRQALLAEAAQRLETTRLLTLTGIGGSGKTRLAARLAERVRHRFPDGVWFIDLAPLDDVAQVCESLAAALGVRPDGAQSLATLAAMLRGRCTLIVLDNCEHLLDALSGSVDALLRAAPQLRLLATSREALGLDGEALLPVRPLALPEPGAAAETIAQAESVSLFVQRAMQATPGFRLDARNAVTVAEVCRRVDGIPLAIELAAAQLRMVSPQQLHGLLEERFRLMAGARRALPRQQSLRTVIAWSLERLQPGDRKLLGALSVCGTGCDFDAARALAGPGTDADAVLASLARLADQSLLTLRHDAGAVRYTLLETVRQLALEGFDDGAAAAVRERHTLHFLALAEALAAQMHRERTGAEVIQTIDRERENMLRAIDGLERSARPDAPLDGLRLCAALRHYWPSRGLLALGLRIGQSSLARAAGLSPSQPHLLALISTAQFAGWLGRHDEALVLAQRHLAMAGALGDGAAQAGAHAVMGAVERSRERLADAARHYEAALDLARKGGFGKPHGDALHGLADIALAQGRLDDAQGYFDAVLALRSAQGHPYHLGVALLNGASVAVDRRAGTLARDRLREADALLPRLDSSYLAQSFVDITAAWLGLQGRWADAATLAAASEAQCGALELPLDASGQAGRERLQAQACGALGEAAHRAARARGRSLDATGALALASQSLGANADATAPPASP